MAPEPEIKLILQVPEDQVGAAIDEICRIHGRLSEDIRKSDGVVIIKTEIPVSQFTRLRRFLETQIHGTHSIEIIG